MDEMNYQTIKDKIYSFQYSSMIYVDFEDIRDYNVISNNDQIILLYGFNKESKKYEYHWACNHVTDLLKAIIPCQSNVLITFIPSEWVNEVEQSGLKIYAKWKEYIMPDIKDVVCDLETEFITIKEADQVSKLTISCTGQSRGFAGQTKEWVEQWLQGTGPAVPSYVIDSTILAYREQNEIQGVICVGIYSNQNHEGFVVWIRELAVKREYQGRGIARQLLKQAFVYGKSKGAKKAFLMADECNEVAIHLYESIGFIARDEEAQIDMIS